MPYSHIGLFDLNEVDRHSLNSRQSLRASSEHVSITLCLGETELKSAALVLVNRIVQIDFNLSICRCFRKRPG